MIDVPLPADPVDVRELDRDDLDYLLKWRMESVETVFALDRPWDDDAIRDANRAYYEEHLGVDHIACMASIDGEDVGMGAVCIQKEMPSPDNPSGRCAYVMSIYTRPEARGRGVGRAVVETLIAYAHARGADKVYLEATDEGAPLYESLGFEPMVGMMKLARPRP